jgi:hypothetical protein
VPKIRGGEPKDSVAGTDEEILPAIVADEPIPVVTTIELDDEMGRRVVEVGPAEELTRVVVEIRLYFRRG